VDYKAIVIQVGYIKGFTRADQRLMRYTTLGGFKTIGAKSVRYYLHVFKKGGGVVSRGQGGL
jgi:hypothetical protein